MASDAAAAWNARYLVGTPVRYRPILGEDAYELAETRTPAWLLGHGRAVVSITGRTGGVFLEHVEVLRPEAELREQIEALTEEVQHLQARRDADDVLLSDMRVRVVAWEQALGVTILPTIDDPDPAIPVGGVSDGQ